MPARFGAPLLVAAIMLLAAPAALAAPDFSWTPASPQVGQTVTFTARDLQRNSTVLWDFGDGGSATGTSAQHAYSTPGPKTVRMRVTRPGNRVTEFVHTVTVTAPAPPPSGTTPPPSGTAPPSDGSTPPAGGGTTTPPAGSSTPAAPVSTTSPTSGTAIPIFGTGELQLLSPFPVVRLVGRVTSLGTRIRLLGVRGPRGAKVTVRCRGGGCTFRRKSRVASLGRVHFTFRRVLRPGARIAIFVTRSSRIGKYTRFRIRRGRPPARLDLCMWPGEGRPRACPST